MLVTASPTRPKISYNAGAPLGTPDDPSQMARRAAISPSMPGTKAGFSMAGSTMTMGMKSRTLRTPTTAKSSATRDRGRRQWLLVNRKAAVASGAPLVTMKTKEKAAM